jgi:hypothetical protein
MMAEGGLVKVKSPLLMATMAATLVVAIMVVPWITATA